jgi:hypothetical protein
MEDVDVHYKIYLEVDVGEAEYGCICHRIHTSGGLL